MIDGVSVGLVLVLLLVLGAEFVNGSTDAPNSIATVVSTRVLSPRNAIVMATVLNALGVVSGTAVAKTIYDGFVAPGAVTGNLGLLMLGAAMVGIIAWSGLAWRYGLPTSETHALVASLTGAAFAAGGVDALLWVGWQKVLIGLLFSTLLGFGGGLVLIVAISWIFRRFVPRQVQTLFGRLQVLSAAFMAFSHGSNDGQKFMGAFTLALIISGAQERSYMLTLDDAGRDPQRVAQAIARQSNRTAEQAEELVHSRAGTRKALLENLPRAEAEELKKELSAAGAKPSVKEQFDVPWWVMLLCSVVMAFGTSIGGWRIIRTMGMRMVKLEPYQGFAAEMGAASTIELASRMGIPVSTTHTISTSIMGVGAARKVSAVRWGVVREVVAAWILTFPVCGLIGFTIVWVCRLFLP